MVQWKELKWKLLIAANYLEIPGWKTTSPSDGGMANLKEGAACSLSTPELWRAELLMGIEQKAPSLQFESVFEVEEEDLKEQDWQEKLK